MNQDIKKRWVSALRSGEYKQGQDYLAFDDKYCCLGVLCEIAVADGVIDSPVEQEDGVKEYAGVSSILPSEVVEWAELSSSNPWVVYDSTDQPISDPNDSRVPFSVIADLIENQL